MESSGAGALALQAAPLPDYPYTQQQLSDTGQVTVNEPASMDFNDYSFSRQEHAANALNTPIHNPSIDHFRASNLRASIGGQHVSSPISNDAANAANILANGTSFDPFEGALAHLEPATGDIYQQYTSALDSMVDPFEPEPTQEELLDGSTVNSQRENMRAYAKIVLPDGDFYVTSQKVIIGRNMDYFKKYNREQRKVTLREEQAKRALEDYKQEPSQPSQPDDGDNQVEPSVRSNESLEGRPARALPSNYSEQGGAVSYVAASDDEHESRRKKRKRKILISKSSSTTSVTPANLHPQTIGNMMHPNPFAEDADAAVDDPPAQFLPVHTINRDHLRKISKEHLIIEYNSEEEKWELEVIGRTGAFVNNELHPPGNVVFLNHNDTISMASSLHLVFKLPDVARPSPGLSKATTFDGEMAEDEDLSSAVSTSPVRRLSNAIQGDDDDDEAELVGGESAKPKPKLTLKLKKTVPPKDKAQKKPKEPETPHMTEPTQQQPPAAPAAQSPEVAKKLEKGKKPKGATKEPASPLKDDTKQDTKQETNQETHQEVTTPPPPAVPTNLEPGSIFEGVAAEELPQKRKGPGRPPKNGLISKRDQSFVKRKLKDYEKRGEAPPPMDTLVAIVRAENKAKEAAAKATQRGEAPPDMPGVMQSIEMDTTLLVQRPEAVPVTDMAQKISVTPVEPVRKMSPNLKRVARSLSPMKPEHDYTEDDLKKPTVTYVHILDEVLRAHPEGRADLQEIYDLICKRYPFYKYRTGTAGWQSSVRHNLLQHERFKENGRSGKGRLWSVNYDCPLEKEKKRRPSPPPRSQMPHMQNGQYAPSQIPYGQPNYNAQYGQVGMNGQPPYNAVPQPGIGTYYSPYAPSQGGPYTHAQGPPGAPAMPGVGQPGHIPASGPSQYPQAPPPPPPPRQQASQPAPHFQAIVDEIMQYRTRYLAGFAPDSEEFKQHDERFKKCTNYLSDFFHGATDRAEADVASDEERLVFEELKAIFNKYEHLREAPTSRGPNASGTPAVDAAPSNVSGQTASGVLHNSAGGPNGPNVAPTAVTHEARIGKSEGYAGTATPVARPAATYQVGTDPTVGNDGSQPGRVMGVQPSIPERPQSQPHMMPPAASSGTTQAMPLAQSTPGTKRAADDAKDDGDGAKRMRVE